MSPSAPIVFVCSAQADQEAFAELQTHLGPLVFEDRLAVVGSNPGTPPDPQVQHALKHACAAVLLVSPAFLASPGIRSHELPVLLGRNAADRLPILTVILSPGAYQDVPFRFPDPRSGPLQRKLADFWDVNRACRHSRPWVELDRAARDGLWTTLAQTLRKLAAAAPPPALRASPPDPPAVSPSPPLFRWLQLAGPLDEAAQATLTAELRARAEARPQALVLLGGLGAGGDPQSVAPARRRLLTLARAGGLGREQVFAIPAPGDLPHGPEEPALTRLLRRLRAGIESLDTALADPQDREQLRARLAAYLTAAEHLAPASRRDARAELFWREDEGALRIVGLNTVLLATAAGDPATLRLGSPQLELLDAAPPLLVLGAHPLERLTEGAALAARLRGRGVYVHPPAEPGFAYAFASLTRQADGLRLDARWQRPHSAFQVT